MFASSEDSLPRELENIVYNLGSNGTNGAWISMVLSSIVGAIFGCWFTRSAITENTQFNWLWKLYIMIATHGGTLFNEADLIDAKFTSATLKGANFKNANITRTRWGGVRSLEHSRVGNSYLKYPKVRQLVLGRKLKNINFDSLNLEGVSLEASDLSDASFIATNLKSASLKGSNLKQANLQQAKLNDADLSNTCLTGACLQDWTIDESTILDNIECDYIFLEKLPDRLAGRRRFPPTPNNFRLGDFEKFFRKDSSVLQLLIHGEDDRQALTAAFQQLVNGDHYQIQGFEMIGDDALVKIKVPENVDRSVVENKFWNDVRAELEEANQDPVSHEQPSLEKLLLKVYDMGANKHRIINIQKGNYIESNSGTYAQGDIINMSQDLGQAAAQIQVLLDQLKQSGVVDEVAQGQVAKDISTEANKNQTVKEKLSNWGASLASATVSDVVKGVVKLACKSAGIPL